MIPIPRKLIRVIDSIELWALREMLNYSPSSWSKVPVVDLPSHLAQIGEIRQIADALQLKESVKLATRFESELKNHGYQPVKYSKFIARINESKGRVDDELENIIFGFVPIDLVQFLQNDELFGSRVAERFPRANLEIQSAGNCFAHGLNTATVFHLMRAVEIGAKAMVKVLRARQYLTTTQWHNGKQVPILRPVELCDWKMLRDGLNKALVDLEAGSRTNLAKKNKLEFFSHAVSQFGNFKDAWRNKVSHSNKIYLKGETFEIMNNTRQFLVHLFERVKE